MQNCTQAKYPNKPLTHLFLFAFKCSLAVIFYLKHIELTKGINVKLLRIVEDKKAVRLRFTMFQ